MGRDRLKAKGRETSGGRIQDDAFVQDIGCVI